jgi:hypothetical protein
MEQVLFQRLPTDILEEYITTLLFREFNDAETEPDTI